jgi:DNA mismatch repair protein MutL
VNSSPTPTVAVLPSAVADQIAAGEVVERPASVVKELVENALDAGARAIEVTVTDGGRALVRVADDGHGMSRTDATLAVERHATSKIRSAADLVGVESFGFRGEALPAIGSVARLEIETSTDDGGGTRVRVVGGKREQVDSAARRRGTTVSVESLFFNTPARLKFMKGVRSEWRAIQDALTAVALSRRDVRLTVRHDDKEAMALPAAASLRDRVAALWGEGFADALVEVNDVSGPIRVSGLAERPADVGLASRRIFLSVNGRAVRDGGVVRAAESAYRSTLPSGVRPTLLLEIVLPAADVDVNVHPAKAEVRFRDRWTLERAVERAVRHALGTGDGAPFVYAPAATGQVFAPNADVDVAELRRPSPDAGPLFGEAPAIAAPGDPVPQRFSPSSPSPANPTSAPSPHPDSLIIPPLIQLRRTWLMCEADDAVVLIDQHSAHERILYERFMLGMAGGDVSSQTLLFPLTLHLSVEEAEAFEAHRDVFAKLGFQAESFGGSTVAVHAVPAPHRRFDAERCLRESLATLAGDRSPSTLARHERLAATVACKGAIKAGEVLTPEEMRGLYAGLARTTLPAYDVHGRATIVKLGWDELERRFGRR